MNKKDIYKKGLDLWLNLNVIEKIILKITGLTKNQLFLINKIENKYKEIIEQSFLEFKKTQKLEYIINKSDFFSLEFYIDNRVLVPRDETEKLVEETLEYIKNNNLKNICLIDIWTWSWCIAISINKNTKIKKTYALDISKKALEVSKINIKKYKLENKIKVFKSNLLEKIFLREQDLNKFDNIIITANLPYIKDNDLDNMDLEVKEFEPNIALFWWNKTGFELYEKLIKQIDLLSKVLKKNISLFIEIWFDQKDFLEKTINRLGYNYKIFKDNLWINRWALIRIWIF